jgi:glycosyltransferase involved in cell wall biosynthesis
MKNMNSLQNMMGTIKKPLKANGPLGTISVCMIVKNEEKNIADAIKSFLPFADEIIVNDTGSTDRTLEILNSLPVRVIKNKWENDFSLARNQSLDAATSAWVIWMDADDRVPSDQVESFLKLKTAPLDRCFGFQIVNTQAGMPIGTRFMQIRMFPNHPSIRFVRAVHEQVIPSLAELGLYSFFIETLIWHTGYENDELKKRKAQRNIDLLLGNPERDFDPIVGMQEGDSYSIIEDWELAIRSYEHAYKIEGCEKIHKDAYDEIPNCIGRCYYKLNDLENAEKWFLEAYKNNHQKIEAKFYLGELYFKSGNEVAEEWLIKAVKSDRTFSAVANQYDVMHIYSYNYLCQLFKDQRRFEEMKFYAEKFFEKYPKVNEAEIYLGKAYLSLGVANLALKHLSSSLESGDVKERSSWEALFFALEKSDSSAYDIERWKKKYETLFSPASSSQIDCQIDLSVCMIIKNESTNIIDCLDSIQSLGAQVVIVDTGSTDDSLELIGKYSVEVYHYEWNNNFSKARNFSLEKAKGKWVLWLDADDRLLESDKEDILRYVRQEANQAFAFMVKNSSDGGKNGSVFAQIRLFPNHKGVRFEGRVHEQLSPSLSRLQIPVRFCETKIIHTGYFNREIVVKKQKRNLDIMLEEFKNNPNSITAVKLYSVAGSYQDLEEFDRALEYYEKAFERGEKRGEDPHIVEFCDVKIAECLASMGNYQESQARIDRVLAKDSKNVSALFLKGQLLFSTGDPEHAFYNWLKIFYFEEKQTLIPVDLNQFKVRILRSMGEYFYPQNQNLGTSCLRLAIDFQKQNRKVSADVILGLLFDEEMYTYCECMLEFAINMCPSFDEYFDLIKIYVLINKIPEALSTIENAKMIYGAKAELKQLEELIFADLGIR